MINLKSPDDNDSWDTKFRKCVCDEGFKESPMGCIDDPCYHYSCGNGGKCVATLIKDRGVRPNPQTYHYEASCTCPEDYVEFNLGCILNPCLDYDCYEYGYCEAVEDQCECKEGYVEFAGELLYNEDGTSYSATDTITCVSTSKSWDWRKSDKECQHYDNDTTDVRYAYYGDTLVPAIVNPCSNGIKNCSCILSPFSEFDNIMTLNLKDALDYTKDMSYETGYRAKLKHYTYQKEIEIIE